MPALHYPGTPGTMIYGGRASIFIPEEPEGELPWPTVANELVVSLPSGSATNYPLQFGRAFPLGAVADTPEVLIGGTPVAQQQADIKTRHSDGSVKFAVISVILPSISTTEQTLVIGNKAAPATPIAATVASLLAADFDAVTELEVSGVALEGAPASARSMLASLTDAALAAETASNGVNSRYWTVGPVCTTFLIHDHTTKAWDCGTNATRSIRPLFEVQWWPSIGQWKARHIIEIADVTKLKDEPTLTIRFRNGFASPVTHLDQTYRLHAGQFQTRAYWGGAAVPRANIKHGVAYMASTRAIQNYDSSISINQPSVDSYIADYASRSKALGANLYFTKAMAATGGRPEIGMIPKWDLVALYSGHATLHEITERSNEVFGSFTFFYREGSDAKTIYGSTPGRGRVLSKLSRPTLFWSNEASTVLADRITRDGTLDAAPDSWAKDDAHTPGAFWMSYLTTGEHIWKEKIQQLGAWSQFITNPGTGYNSVANGNSSSALILNGLQTRAFGWQMRNRGRAMWVSDLGSPERQLFDQSITDAAAMRAGLLDVPGMMVGNPIRDAWNANHLTWYGTGVTAPRPNPLKYIWFKGAYTGGVDGKPLPPDSDGSATALWMHNFVAMSLNHVVELGRADIAPLAHWSAQQSILIANSSEPRHIADYQWPDVRSDKSFYQALDGAGGLYEGYTHDADGAYPTSMPAASSSGFGAAGAPNTYGVSVELYGSIAAAAIASANGADGQSAAWSVIQPWHQSTIYYNHDPRFAIIPRA